MATTFAPHTLGWWLDVLRDPHEYAVYLRPWSDATHGTPASPYDVEAARGQAQALIGKFRRFGYTDPNVHVFQAIAEHPEWKPKASGLEKFTRALVGGAALLAGGLALGGVGAGAGAAASAAPAEVAAVDLTAETFAAGLTAEQIAGTAALPALAPAGQDWLEFGKDLAKKWASGRVMQALAPDRPVDVAAAATPPVAPGGVRLTSAPQAVQAGAFSPQERTLLLYGGLGLAALLVVAMVRK